MLRTRIIAQVSLANWLEVRSDRTVRVHAHAFDHILRGERSIYGSDVLIRAVRKERPRLIGWQRNGRIALYFRRDDGFLKIIVDVDEAIVILTFMNVGTIPDVRALPRRVIP